MKCQFILFAAICLACSYALPVPDEEVSAVQTAPAVSEIKSDVVTKPEDKPVEPVQVKGLESRAVEEKSAAIDAPAKTEENKAEVLNSDLKNAPNLETAPAIADKKLEEKTETVAGSLDEKKEIEKEAEREKENKKTARTEEIVEQPKAVPLIETPSSNIEIQKQIVDESKPAVHASSVAVGKSSELPKESKNEEKNDLAAEADKVKEQQNDKTLGAEEFKEPQTAEKSIELKSNETPAAAAPISPEPIAAASENSPVVVVPEGNESSLKSIEEKQPARQERINEQEKLAQDATVPVKAHALKSAGGVEDANVAAPAAGAEEQKPAELVAGNEQTEAKPELKKNIEEASAKPIEGGAGAAGVAGVAGVADIGGAAASAAKNAENIAAEPKKIEEVGADGDTAFASASKLADPAKKEEANKAADEKILEEKKIDEKKPLAGGKSDAPKKPDESKESAESKESDESDNSKENKSN